MKLKVGDKVRIKEDLEFGMYTSSDGKCREDVMDEMWVQRGKVVTIDEIAENGYIFANQDGWRWVDTMFEEVITNKVPELKEGMAVHCDTEEKSKIFLQECKKQGITCCDRSSATTLNVWHQLKENTCYCVRRNIYRNGGKLYLEFDGKHYYNNVLEFDDLFKGYISDNNKKVENVAKYRKTKYEVMYYRPDFIHLDVEKVMTNDNTTIVILKTGEKGVAKCSPNDNFNLIVGYELARNRARIEHFKNMIIKEEDKIKCLIGGDFQ